MMFLFLLRMEANLEGINGMEWIMQKERSDDDFYGEDRERKENKN